MLCFLIVCQLAKLGEKKVISLYCLQPLIIKPVWRQKLDLNSTSCLLLGTQRNLEHEADGSGLCLLGSTLRWNQDRSQKQTHTCTHRRTHAGTFTSTHKHSQYFTPCICQLQTRFVCRENIRTSKLSSVPYTHCESVVQNTTAEERTPPGEIPKYRLDDSTLQS